MGYLERDWGCVPVGCSAEMQALRGIVTRHVTWLSLLNTCGCMSKSAHRMTWKAFLVWSSVKVPLLQFLCFQRIASIICYNMYHVV